MFTGIVETLGEIIGLEKEGQNLHLDVKTTLAAELKIDQSVAHNGVCLTVIQQDSNTYRVTAILETLVKSNLSDLKMGSLVNLERCMKMGARLDGHMVQGHVDSTGVVKSVTEEDGSWRFQFEYAPEFKKLLVPKGSITVNGVSLTVVDVSDSTFSVAIIPFTFEHTNFHQFKVGNRVNLEFDIIGKYVERMLAPRLQSLGL